MTSGARSGRRGPRRVANAVLATHTRYTARVSLPPSTTTKFRMSQRKTSKVAAVTDGHSEALQKYNDTEGHFSLVRFVHIPRAFGALEATK